MLLPHPVILWWKMGPTVLFITISVKDDCSWRKMIKTRLHLSEKHPCFVQDFIIFQRQLSVSTLTAWHVCPIKALISLQWEENPACSVIWLEAGDGRVQFRGNIENVFWVLMRRFPTVCSRALPDQSTNNYTMTGGGIIRPCCPYLSSSHS